MKLISSKVSFGNKIFPYLFFGFLGFFVVMLLIHGAYREAPLFLAVPAMIAFAGYSAWKTTMADLADQVYDGGDYLLIRKDGREETVLFSNILNVDFTIHRRGAAPRIALTLRTPGKFGNEITFAPPRRFSWGFTSRCDLADDLLSRAEKAGSGRI